MTLDIAYLLDILSSVQCFLERIKKSWGKDEYNLGGTHRHLRIHISAEDRSIAYYPRISPLDSSFQSKSEQE